jgi:hypothetical protein
MTINHLPSMRLQRFTYETFGYFTSAEGFVLISGITCGWVYGGPRGLTQTQRILRRCAYIALAYILLRLVTSAMPHGIRSGDLGVAQAGILLMYVVYLLPLPWVLRQFDAGNGERLLCASFGLWMLAQWRIGPELSVGYLFAWQFLFMAGAWIGHSRRRGTPLIPGYFPEMALKAAAVCSIVFFFLRHPLVHAPVLSLGWEITSKEALGIVRVINLAVFGCLIARIPRSLDEKWANLGVSRAVSFLGCHSLQVFAWHAIIVCAFQSYLQQWASTPESLKTLMTAVVIASLFIPAYLHQYWRVRDPERSSFVRWVLQ